MSLYSRAIVAGFGLALAAGAAGVSCTTRQGEISIVAVDTLARGRYLTTVLGCGDCHTPGTFYGAPDTTRRLAGSEVGWKGPWGVSYPRNLTPDAATGIGGWSEEQIVAAVRTGIRPDGRQLLPPMPWPDFAALTDEDAYSVARYLKSLPAVSHQVPEPVPPGKPARGSIIVVPPPSAWDAPQKPAAGDSAGGH